MGKENLIKIHFSYSDEKNLESTLTKTFPSASIYDSSMFDLLLNEFKVFLIASGYSEETVNRIYYDEN